MEKKKEQVRISSEEASSDAGSSSTDHTGSIKSTTKNISTVPQSEGRWTDEEHDRFIEGKFFDSLKLI